MVFPTWFFFDRVGPLFKVQFRNRNQDEWLDVPFSEVENFRWTHYFYNPRKTMWLYINSLAERIAMTALNDPTEIQTKLQSKLMVFVRNWLGSETSEDIELQILIQNPPKDSISNVVWTSLV